MRDNILYTKEQVIELIDDFADKHPGSLYTFGHNVLDDYNLSDGNIFFCLRQDTIDKWFEYAMKHWDHLQYSELTELRDATIAFLRYLLTIPEDVRDGEIKT